MCGVYVHTHISVWECKVQSPISSDLCMSHSFHFSSTSSLFHFRDNGELTLVWIPIKNIRNGLQKQGYNSFCCALSLSEDLNRILLVFLCVLFLFFFKYKTDLELSRPLGVLRKVDRDKRCGSQLPLHLLCTLESPNCSEAHDTTVCLCLLHHQVQQKQTSSKLYPFCLVSFDESSMKMETSLVKALMAPSL